MATVEQSNMILTSTKPYLVRALYDWILDNQCTPFVVVNAEFPEVEVPKVYVEDGRIVLNISDDAVRNLKISNEALEFNARFNGVSTHVYVPIHAILAIYAQENGHGMVFNEEETPASDDSTSQQRLKKKIKRPMPTDKPMLHVVKPEGKTKS
jgi:stringent starvation protein B